MPDILLGRKDIEKTLEKETFVDRRDYTERGGVVAIDARWPDSPLLDNL